MGVEKVVKFATENQEYIAEIKKALNITDDLTMREMDSIIEWSEYQFGPDIIIEAIRRTREGKKGAGSRGIIFPYVSALLKIWRDAEIKTIQDIDDYTNQMIQVNARKQQYRQTQKATVEVVFPSRLSEDCCGAHCVADCGGGTRVGRPDAGHGWRRTQPLSHRTTFRKIPSTGDNPRPSYH